MKTAVYTGIDNISTVKKLLDGNKLGLITGPTGVTRSLLPTYLYIDRYFHLTALFSPEHGLRGSDQAGIFDKSYKDKETGIIVYSLNEKDSYLSQEMLSNVDILLFDMQDVGSRFYTYISTMIRAMKSCAKYKKPFFILDRPNPVSLNRIEGNMLDNRFCSFVGECIIPTRYSMTIGELALYINSTEYIGCDLTVVPCEGLNRSMYFDETDLPFVMPSPNIPTIETAINYIGTCLFEGTNLSEGRGTTHPFELIGAPWLRSESLCYKINNYGFEGVLFRRAFFRPTFSKYAGELCEGFQLHITDREKYQPFAVALRIIDEIRASFPELRIYENFDYLFGDDCFRNVYTNHSAIDRFFFENDYKLKDFKEKTRRFYLY